MTLLRFLDRVACVAHHTSGLKRTHGLVAKRRDVVEVEAAVVKAAVVRWQPREWTLAVGVGTFVALTASYDGAIAR